MKKNNKTKKNEYSTLDNELGKFGIDPPKHYREDIKKEYQKSIKNNGSQKKPDNRNKQKKKRKRSKLFYKAISIVAIILAIVTVLVTLSLTVFFKIDKINVTGNEKYSKAEIIDVLPIELGKNLFLAKTENAKLELEEKLPYIYNAELKRKLPSTLVVNLTETPTVYAIKNSDKTYLLLDDNLKVLEKNALKKPKKSVIIKDADVQSAKIGAKAKLKGKKTNANVLKLTAIVRKLDLKEVTAISSVDINTNSLTYDNRIVIKVGTVENLENKIYAALTAIEKLNESDPNASGTIVANNDKQIYFTEE